MTDVPVTPAKRVYYVIRRASVNRYAGIATGYGSPWQKTPQQAAQFTTLRDAAAALTRIQGDPTTEIVRIEETRVATPAKRELVTRGDLSLLDGPVVVITRQGGGTVYHLSPNHSWSNWSTHLEDAQVFPTQDAALRFINSNQDHSFSGCKSLHIVPIRETPQDTTVNVVETVVA